MDIFLSYSRDDTLRARQIVDAIGAAGFSIWWDDDIRPDATWDETLEREIEAARAVVVLWSQESVRSRWVRTEAHYANERGKLIPVQIAACELPLAFSLVQTADLASWSGDENDRHWRKVLGWLEELVDEARDQSPGATPRVSSWRAGYGETASGELVFDGSAISERTPRGTLFRDGQQLPLMCVMGRGEFTMGSPDHEPGRRPSEGPQHGVNFSTSFALGVFPVTVSEWAAIGDDAGISSSAGPAARNDHPVTNVSWIEAQGFVTTLRAQSDANYRLPSEAEWEYSCRAGTTTSYSFGDMITPELATYRNDATQPGGPTPIALHPPNRMGLHEMHGNVREWTADPWHDSYIAAPTDGLAWNTGHSSMRVVRGGSWGDEAWFVRSAARGRAQEADRSGLIGLRVARSI